ncbi:hypothetical protein Vi05172_g1869 [Venturia inaequalis]|nr:hypothetical protein Vi05172_g1869 [Venturia inaequalis]
MMPSGVHNLTEKTLLAIGWIIGGPTPNTITNIML